LPRAFHNAGHNAGHNTGDTMALRLDRRGNASALGFEIGALMEEGGILGSLASGGLTMADRSATSWLSASYTRDLLEGWSLKASMTLAATGTERPGASLITSIGPVYATSFALGFGRKSVFVQDDALSFAVSQPLRAEDAPVTLTLGAGYDPAAGRIAFVPANASLVPSGREIDLESGYRFALGAWTGAMDVAYSVDAGHMRGVDAVSGLFWLSRKF
jgi:hypothetical protein